MLCILLICFLIHAVPLITSAEEITPLDEIEHFFITVDVQEDATLLMNYHIDWKVLADEKDGPLSWVHIGLPNYNHSDITAKGNSIAKIKDTRESLYIYLDREYYAGEVVSIDFSFVQDQMYLIDRDVKGETVYVYTPAWFNEMEVKDLTIRWNADKVSAWDPDCRQEGGYHLKWWL